MLSFLSSPKFWWGLSILISSAFMGYSFQHEIGIIAAPSVTWWAISVFRFLSSYNFFKW